MNPTRGSSPRSSPRTLAFHHIHSPRRSTTLFPLGDTIKCSTNSSAILQTGKELNAIGFFDFCGNYRELPVMALFRGGDPPSWPPLILPGGWQQPRGECHRDARALKGRVPEPRKLVKISSDVGLMHLSMDQDPVGA